MTGAGNSSIDELLRYEDELVPTSRKPFRSMAGWWLANTLFAVAIAALVLLALRAANVAVPYLLAFTVVLALLVMRKQLRAVAAPPPPRAAMVRPSSSLADESAYQWGSLDGLRAAVGRWESRLVRGYDSVDRFARLRQQLVELIDERLRLRHGVSLAADPTRARALLGETLWTFLECPVRKPLTPRELAVVLSRMEEL